MKTYTLLGPMANAMKVRLQEHYERALPRAEEGAGHCSQQGGCAYVAYTSGFQRRMTMRLTRQRITQKAPISSVSRFHFILIFSAKPCFPIK